jgi:hypothetical protein
MHDEDRRRYARHIMLPDVGEAGQAALMAATAQLRAHEPAALVAGEYLAAGGVGTTVDGDGREVVVPATPAWWPSVDGDATALAFWRGGVAAINWMTGVLSR